MRGHSGGSALRAFLAHIGAIPDLAAITAGREAEVPQAMELQYAVASALVRHIGRLPAVQQAGAAGHALDYARRFPQREIGVMLVMDLQRVLERPLYQLPAFAAWAEEVGDLLSFERE